jgi:hypothetical protein
MRQVQDLLFIETLDFSLPLTKGEMCVRTARAMSEAALLACQLVGIELVDYESVLFVPHRYTQAHAQAGVKAFQDETRVQLRSKAWRERVERQTGTMSG